MKCKINVGNGFLIHFQSTYTEGRITSDLVMNDLVHSSIGDNLCLKTNIQWKGNTILNFASARPYFFYVGNASLY